MKIIEALKKVKDLRKKIDDITSKIKMHAADLDCETPVYPDQKRQVSEWLQSVHDITKEILKLKYRIQKTNVNTPVTIELGGQHVTKFITEWIERRKNLAEIERQSWLALNDKGLKETYPSQKLTANSPEIVVKRRLYFDASERDAKVELFRSEPSTIDATLEIINAVTDLLD